MQLTPVIYEHAARCHGLTPWAASRSAVAMADAHLAAWRLYRHAPVTLGIDLYNPEPEAFGAVVDIARGGEVPAIRRPPFAVADLVRLPELAPASAGRLPLILAAASRLRAGLPPGHPVAVPAQGPFSCAVGLVGLEALMLAAQEEPDAVAAGLDRLAQALEPWLAAIAAAGAAITVFDSAAAPPLLSPRLFRRIALPPLRRFCAAATRLAGRPPFLVMGGDIAAIAGDLATCGCGGLVVPAETDQGRCLAALAAHPQLAVRLNLPVSAVLAGPGPSWDAALARATALAGQRPGCTLGTGVLPWDVEPQRLAAWLAFTTAAPPAPACAGTTSACSPRRGMRC